MASDHRLGRRLPSEILCELLRLADQGESKTRLMYGANLSHALLERYLAFLLARGFLVPDGPRFRLTPEGRGFLRDLGTLVAWLRTHREETLPRL